MLKKTFSVTNHSSLQSLALLILRLVVGIAFLHHGWMKIQSPFGWMPPESGVPAFFQFLAAISEFGGGLALVLGLLTPLAMLGLTFTMVVATSMHAFILKDPFVSATGGRSFELALVYLSIALTVMLLGPGKFSLDSKIFGKK